MVKSTPVEPVFAVVVWDDAWGDSTDSAALTDAHEKHRPTVMQTVGWVLVDNERGVSIFNERCLDKGEESYRSRTFVPRAMIRSVTPFSLTRKRKKKEPSEVPNGS